jgi:hypothetical protein
MLTKSAVKEEWMPTEWVIRSLEDILVDHDAELAGYGT